MIKLLRKHGPRVTSRFLKCGIEDLMKKAFTLIELLVVIGIIVLLTAMSVYLLTASRNKRQVKSTAEQIKSFLMEARSSAMNTADSDTNVTYYEVQLNSGQLELLKSGSTTPVQKMSLGGNTLTGFQTIRYSADGSTRGQITGNEVSFTIKREGDPDSKTIKIDRLTGLVTIN